MNKRLLKRVAAFAMAATMVFGNAAVALAADGTATGRSTYEGVVKPATYLQITVPTEAATDQFDFIADPNGLIDGVSKTTLGYTISGTDTGVYFATGSTLKSTSEPINVVNENYGGAYIGAEMKIKTAGSDTVTFATSSTWASTVKAKQLYLALQENGAEGTNFDYVKADGSSAKINVLIPGKPSNFTTSFTTASSETAAFGETRSYFVTASNAAFYGDPTKWESKGFQLYGAINKNAAWTQGDLVMPKIEVTWDFTQAADAVLTVNATTGVITMSGLTGAQNFAHKISLICSKGEYDLNSDSNVEWNVDNWSESEGGTLTLTLNSGWMTYLSGEKVTVRVEMTDGSVAIATQSIA
jgi:hypothetical protein